MAVEELFKHTLLVVIIGAVIGSAWGAAELSKDKSKARIIIEFFVGIVFGISAGMHFAEYAGVWLAFLSACVIGAIGTTILTIIKGLAPDIIKKYLERKTHG